MFVCVYNVTFLRLQSDDSNDVLCVCAEKLLISVIRERHLAWDAHTFVYSCACCTHVNNP